jgi:hypothetical protein
VLEAWGKAIEGREKVLFPGGLLDERGSRLEYIVRKRALRQGVDLYSIGER